MKKYDIAMMKTAEVWAEQSKCIRAKVGAVIAKDGRIISVGYNGTPTGYSKKIKEICNCCNGRGVNGNCTCYCCGGFGYVEVPQKFDCEEEKEILVSKCCEADLIEDKEKRKVFCSKCGKQIGIIDFLNDNSNNYRIVGDFEVKKELKTNHDIVIHAELNAILFCAKNGLPTKDTTLYVTLSPCHNCAKHIIQAGIRRVVYKEEYRDTSGLEFLKENGVKVERLQYD